jgi:Cysteine-rich CWC
MKFASPKNNEPSVCASCGETFGCGAKLEGCWCTEVTLSEEILAGIAKEFNGCLCPKCLLKVAHEKPHDAKLPSQPFAS